MNDWTIIDHTRDRELYADSRSEGEEKLEEFEGQLKLELLDPNGNTACVNWEDNKKPRVETEDSEEAKADGGTTVEPEVVDESEEEVMMGVDICVHCESEIDDGFCPNCDENRSSEVEPEEYDLPDKPRVDQDPLTWMPEEFTDTIDQSVAINRKGYEVMARHYGIGTPDSECVVGPEETDYTFCRVKAMAETEDGTTYTAHGSAHVDRGDDSFLLLEMADTRARKRVLAQATGVGMVAVSEIQSGVQDE